VSNSSIIFISFANFFKAHPEAKEIQRKPLANYDLLEKLFSSSEATGCYALSIDSFVTGHPSNSAPTPHNDKDEAQHIEPDDKRQRGGMEGETQRDKDAEQGQREKVKEGGQRAEEKEEEKEGDNKEDASGSCRDKMKRPTGAEILVTAFEHKSNDASTRLQAGLDAKRTRTEGSTISRAANILSNSNYSKWQKADIQKALDLMEDEK
jgi:hypothetical protein